MLLSLWLALAASPPPLTLEEAARLAANDAPAARRAADEAEAAHARVTTARGRLFPTLSAEAGVLSSTDPVDAFALALKQERFSAASFFASDPNHPSSTRDWNGAVSAFWALDLFGSARGEARAAASSGSSADHAARRARDRAAFGAMEAFARARTAQESLEILSERERNAERDILLASSLFEQGMTTAADPARARAAFAEVRAEISARHASLEESRAALAALIGADQSARPLSGLPEPLPVQSEKSAPRDDVLAAELGAKAAGETARAVRAARAPAFFLQGRYEVHAPRPGGRWGDSSSILGGFRLPLWTSGALSGRIAELSASARAAGQAAEEARREAQREIAGARASLEAADAREMAYSEACDAARQAREIQQARYEEGAGRLSDLLEARGAELSAGLAALSARAERVVAGARLRYALGLPPEGEEKP